MKKIGKLNENRLTEARTDLEMNMINSYIPKPTSRTNFEGFRIDSTDVLYYNDFLPNSKYRDYALNKSRPNYESDEEDSFYKYSDAYIAEVTPQEYLDLCYKWVFDKPSIKVKQFTDENMAIFRQDAIRCKRLANVMKDGTKMYLPYIDFRQKGQEGRHRAGAAYLLGIKTIPVLILK